MRPLFSVLLAGALFAPAFVSPGRAADLSSVNPAYFGMLHWRLIGPFRGGRALAVTGVPGEPNHFYFGAVDGGVWESIDAGRTWHPIFDGEPVASIGAIAVAPSDPTTLYVGTGEADMRSDIARGDGMYKSTDGGKTWTHIGLNDSRHIGSIAVDPRNANVVYVAALGHAYGPNAERGVFKTTDGGKTWSKVLYKDANTGAISLAMDPNDANVVYAALWQTRRPPWNVYPPSNGPGSGLYKTTDGGKTWQHLTAGLPPHPGRIGLSISNGAPNRVYAIVDSDVAHGGVYRSDDAGANWSKVDGEPRIWQRGWYFGRITADPRNPDVVYVMNTSLYRSTDGGAHFEAILGDPTGDDYHTLWIDPADDSHMILGSDQGVIVSVDGAKTWSSWYNQPTGQFYHAITDNAFPYWVYGAQQDSGAAMQPSASKYMTISQRDFSPIDVGGENGYLAPDPRHPGLVYGGTVTKELVATGWEQNIDPTLDRPGVVWRSTWTMPVVFSPVDHRTLYFGRQNVFRTRDGGETWQIVSPDLSRARESTPSNLDPSTIADDNGVTRHGVVYAIAPSPLRANLIWAGTDDGLVWITHDGTKSWQNVTPKELTPWSKVGIIEASHFSPNVAYLAVDRHRLDDEKPYIYRTTDGGASWKLIVSGIPDGSFVNVVREDPKVRGLLYAGTEKGVYVSFNDGARWQPLQLNLPVTSVRDIAVHAGDLVVATHGRAFWVMDDIAPLRQLSRAVAAGGNYLFAPAPAYRFIRTFFDGGTPLPLDEPQASNPKVGLYIDYYLASLPRTPVVIDILDARGHLVRHWSSANPPKPIDPQSVDFTAHWIPVHPVPEATAGAHRFVWGFHEGSPGGPLVPPGSYTVRMTVNGRAYARKAVILRDPRSPATDADLIAQYDLARKVIELRDDVEAARRRAQSLPQSGLSPSALQELRVQVVGVPAPSSPDDSVGGYSHDFTSFLYLKGALENLEAAVESADAAPTPTARDAYTKLAAIYRETLSRLDAIEKMR
jgi:photosystem II stability/assembly factor-like uncharacterized protein